MPSGNFTPEFTFEWRKINIASPWEIALVASMSHGRAVKPRKLLKARHEGARYANWWWAGCPTSETPYSALLRRVVQEVDHLLI